MGRLFLPGFPEGAIKIGNASILRKDGQVTYFVGMDNMFSHEEHDRASFRFAICMLIENRHLKVCDVVRSELAIPKSTLMNWLQKFREEGHRAFFKPPKVRGKIVITDEVARQCGSLLDQGYTLAEVARQMDLNDSTLRKAHTAGSIPRKKKA